MSDTFLGLLLATAALLLFTTSTLVTSAASSRINLRLGFLIATLTNVVFSALALAVQLAMRSNGFEWNARAFWLFAVAGGFATYLGRWFFYESVVRFGPAKASIFQISSPLFTALMAWVALGERLTPLVLFAMAMTLGGLVLVSSKAGSFSRSKPAANLAQGAPLKASVRERLLQSVLILGLGSALAYAVGNVLRGVAVRAWNEPVVGGLVGSVFGLALHVMFTPEKQEILPGLRAASESGIWLYVLIGVCTISAQICTIGAMRYIPLAVATLVTLCTPLLVFPLSHWLFRSQGNITATVMLGSALALLGIFIIVMR